MRDPAHISRVAPSTVALQTVRKGRLVRVVEVPEGKARSQLIRLGIARGELLRCLERLPGGTIVVERKRQEIAIGAKLASAILVSPADSHERA